MESGASIHRTEASLQTTCDDLRKLKERYRNVGIADKSLSFNTELTTVLELGFMLDAEAVAFSAWPARESRGSHQRVDFRTATISNTSNTPWPTARRRSADRLPRCGDNAFPAGGAVYGADPNKHGSSTAVDES